VTTIWKFLIKPGRNQRLRLPKGAHILTAQAQFNAVQLWALVDPAAELEDRALSVYATGATAMPDNPGTYIATFQVNGGALVFHVFEDA